MGGREAVVFVLDRSGSMAMRSAKGASAWEEAVKRVQSRLAGLHPESRVRLFCFPPAATGGDWSNPSAMRKVVAGLTPSLADGRPFDALREAGEALARFRSDMPESLEVVGDLQRQGWEEIDTLTLPEELRVHVSQTGDPQAPNRSLALRVRGSDQLRCGVVEVGGGSTPLIVSDRVGADGKAEEREIPLPDKVRGTAIPGRRQRVGASANLLPPGHRWLGRGRPLVRYLPGGSRNSGLPAGAPSRARCLPADHLFPEPGPTPDGRGRRRGFPVSSKGGASEGCRRRPARLGWRRGRGGGAATGNMAGGTACGGGGIFAAGRRRGVFCRSGSSARGVLGGLAGLAARAARRGPARGNQPGAGSNRRAHTRSGEDSARNCGKHCARCR